MSSKKQKQNGHLIPDPIDGYTEFVCYQIIVPDVREYRAAFMGQLRDLEKWFNWDKTYTDGDDRAKRAAAYWRLLLENLEPDNCESGMFDIRQDPTRPCIIQKTVTNGSIWLDSVNMQLCPPKIRHNGGIIQWFNPTAGEWEDLEDGDERTDGDAPIPYPDNPDGACLAAENIAAIYQTALTQLRAGVVASEVAVAIAATITGIMSLFIAPAIVSTIALAITGIALDAGEAGLDDMLTHIEDFKCSVFCNIEDDGSITAADFTAIRDDVATWASGLELSIVQYWLDSFGSVGLQRQALAGGITTGDCEGCDCDDTPVGGEWHILDHSIETEANLFSGQVWVGTTDVDGTFISEREGSGDKEIIFVVSDSFAVGAKTGKRYEIYGKYDHAGYYGSWQPNGFENRWELGYKAAASGNWYGGWPFDLSSVVLPSDGSEVLVQSFDAFNLGGDPNPENHAVSYYLFGRNYNGWRITRIEEVDA